MSIKTNRYESNGWCIEIMDKPWFIDLLTYAIVGIWMALTFAIMQQYGPNLGLLAAAVVVLASGLFMIYNQRLAYLRIGDRIVLSSKAMYEDDDETAPGDEPDEPEDWRERNR